MPEGTGRKIMPESFTASMWQFEPISIDTTDVYGWLVTTGLQILLIIVLAIVAGWLLSVGTRHLARRIQRMDEAEGSELDKRTETIFRLLRTSGLVIIVTIAVLMVLDQLGIDTAPILASVGVFSLTLGLGAQTLVKDVIGGLFILLEGQYYIDDVIEFDGIIGTVEEMTLRATTVRDYQGSLHIVPNGEIRIVTNRTRGWARATVDVGISYEDDLELAERTLEEIAHRATEDPEIGSLMLESPVVTGVEGLEEWQVRLRLTVRTQPNQQGVVQRYLLKQVRQTLPNKGITLSRPRQKVMLVREPK